MEGGRAPAYERMESSLVPVHGPRLMGSGRRAEKVHSLS